MINFKKRPSKAIYSLLILALIGCNNDDDNSTTGNWLNKSAFDGPARSSTVSFVINNLAYVTTGYTGEDNGYLSDLWVYNSDADYWEQKANFTGAGRSSASGFQLDGKGYVGLGYDGTNRLKDFFQYDPTSNTWTQKADFGGTARYGAIGFAVNGRAFMGTGYDGNYQKDIYEYNVATDSWSVNNGYGGNKRRDAAVFVINNMAYIGTGSNNGSYETDFWAFDPSSETWTRKRDLDYKDTYTIVRSNAAGFSMNGYGYIACGVKSGAVNTVWQYEPAADTWSSKSSYEGTVRYDATSFSIGDSRAYVLLGRTGSVFFDDLWEFKPFDKLDTDD